MLAYVCRYRCLKWFKKLAFIILCLFFYLLFDLHHKLRFVNNDGYNPANNSIASNWKVISKCPLNNLSISAIQRARSTLCKQYITNVSCWHQEGILFPKQLPNRCRIQLSDLLVNEYFVGCYLPNNSVSRQEYSYKIQLKNSIRTCWKVCHHNGFRYAELYFEDQCACSNRKPDDQLRIEFADGKCDRNRSIEIYKTGLSNRSYNFETISNQTSAKIVFLLTLNGRAIRQVKRLINVLYKKEHYYYIHVDARQDYLFRQLLPLEKTLPNLKVARKRYSTIWGGASLLTMLLNAMTTISNDLNWNWDYVLNLSETDYPIKSVDHLTQFLSDHRSKNFLKQHAIDIDQFVRRQGLEYIFVECDSHMWRIGRRVLPSNVVITGGSDWVILSRNFVQYLTNEREQDDLVRGLLRFFKFSLLPAEAFFHSVLLNSKFCNTFVDNNLRMINWKRKLGCKCQHKKIVDWCGCSPNVLKIGDLNRMLKSQNKTIFFARKFEPALDSAILNEIDNQILRRPIPMSAEGISFKLSNFFLIFRRFQAQMLTILESYWENVYHYADISPQQSEALLYFGKLVIVKLVTEMNCKTNISGKLIEIHNLFINNAFRGSLMKFSLNNSVMDFETWIRLKPKAKYESHRILKSAFISSNYDQKEQLSRNYLKIFDQYSDLVLIYDFYHTMTPISYFKVILLDPEGYNMQTFYINSTKNSFFELQLVKPLKIGKWVMQLYQNSSENQQLLVQEKFLIFSANFLNPKISDWSQIEEFYEIFDTCIAAYNNLSVFREFCELKAVNNCSQSYWSSLFPDPKSQIQYPG